MTFLCLASPEVELRLQSLAKQIDTIVPDVQLFHEQVTQCILQYSRFVCNLEAKAFTNSLIAKYLLDHQSQPYHEAMEFASHSSRKAILELS